MSATGVGSIAALSELVADFVAERDWERYHAPKNLAAAISVEAAELQELYLWRELDDPMADKRPEIEAEVADIAICLLNFCACSPRSSAGSRFFSMVTVRFPGTLSPTPTRSGRTRAFSTTVA